MQKPYAQSSEENKQVILEAIQPLLKNRQDVLEIGSGTGQHAVYFGKQMPHLIWQTSELAENHPGILLWLEEAGLDNVLPPLALNVSGNDWPEKTYDALFTANTFHIMGRQNVSDLFANISNLLNSQGLVLVYGPFNFNGDFTSDSNRQFDQFLKNRDPNSGIKDFEWLNELAADAGLMFKQDIAMPQNNRILCWQKP
ncbi:DUF938 domain-containing protein [Thiomicrorhabdus sp.]|uniref:DUF938 domain-containing protein n=1 Tax=Thiomicrorhabdus sp. TaxID=2039724 RepID=UPI0035698214